jgi:hypothetical protein
MHDFHGTFKVLLHAANLRHGSEGRRAEDFFALKNPTASAGFEPANLGTKGHRSRYVIGLSFIVCYFCVYNCLFLSRWGINFTLIFSYRLQFNVTESFVEWKVQYSSV